MYITHFHPKRQKSILYFILNAKSILSISSQTSMYALCHPKRLKYTPHFHPKSPKYNPNFYPKRQKFIPYFHPKLAKNIFPMHCIEQSWLIPGQRVVLQQRKRFPKATLPLSRSFFWCSGKISSNNFFLSGIIFISFISCQWYQSKLLYDNHKAQSQANLFWFSYKFVFLSQHLNCPNCKASYFRQSSLLLTAIIVAPEAIIFLSAIFRNHLSNWW